MTLMFIVYLISILGPIHGFLTALIIFGCSATAGILLWFTEDYTCSYNRDKHGELLPEYKEKVETRAKLIKVVPFTTCVLGLVYILIPSQQAGYMMMSAYVGQEVAQSKMMSNAIDGSSEILGKVNTIVNQKLDEYIKESDNKEVKK